MDGLSVTPISANTNVILADGSKALELTYSRCNGLTQVIDDGYNAPTSPVTLYLQGETTGSSLLAVEFTSQFDLNVNW